MPRLNVPSQVCNCSMTTTQYERRGTNLKRKSRTGKTSCNSSPTSDTGQLKSVGARQHTGLGECNGIELSRLFVLHTSPADHSVLLNKNRDPGLPMDSKYYLTSSSMCQPISGFFPAICSTGALHLPVCSLYHIYTVVHTTSVTYVPTVLIV